MKNIITGIITLLFLAILLYVHQELLRGFVLQDLMENQQLQVMAFLALLGLYLCVDGWFSAGQPKGESTLISSESSTSSASSKDDSRQKTAVLSFLSLLQEKGRLLDFVMDDIAPYSDEQVGQVARVVHAGVRDALNEVVKVQPLHSGAEGDIVSVAKEDAGAQYRLVGNLSSQPPFSGKVLHRGWKAQGVSLPYGTLEQQAHADIVQPVEVEVS